jgi:hypothetical protein
MKPSAKFSAKAVEGIIEGVLKEQLEEEKYDAKASKQVRARAAVLPLALSIHFSPLPFGRCGTGMCVAAAFEADTVQITKTLSTIITSRVKALGYEKCAPMPRNLPFSTSICPF